MLRWHVWILSMLWAVPEAVAEPKWTKLSWASADASTTIALTWITPANADTVVEYGIASTSEHRLAGPAPIEISGIGWFHEIELTGLAPNTRYRYRVGAMGDFSAESTFQTAPSDGCSPFTFAQLGDARSQREYGPSPVWPSIQEEARAAGAAFFLNAGDLVKSGDDIAQWAHWLEDSAPVNAEIPMMPTIGNHDDGPGDGASANYNRLFALPTNTVTGTEDYYSFVYNNLLVFSLATQTFEDYPAQASWMRAIASLPEHRNRWKVAFFHHPVYTTQASSLSHEANEHGQNPDYAPLFDEVGIDIVFQSHNHIYERFRPLRFDPNDVTQGREVSTYGNGSGEGRLYVVSGGSGSFTDVTIRFVDASEAARGSEVRSSAHHFMKIAIAGNTLHYSAVTTSAGNTGDGGEVIDSITLRRPGDDPCATPADPDGDGDGYPRSRDCDDANEDVNPGAAEVCGNTVDEDCNRVAERCPDPPTDADGDRSPEGQDCDDRDAKRYPSNTETECNAIDDDCDCLETCMGRTIDVCSMRDAGAPAADTGPGVDAVSNDAGTARPEAGGDVVADAGSRADATRVASTDPTTCGCSSAKAARGGARATPLAVPLLFVLRATRRRARNEWKAGEGQNGF